MAEALGHHRSWDTVPLTHLTGCPESHHLPGGRRWLVPDIPEPDTEPQDPAKLLPSLGQQQHWWGRGDTGMISCLQSRAAGPRAASAAWTPTGLHPNTGDTRGELSPLSMMPSVMKSHSHHWVWVKGHLWGSNRPMHIPPLSIPVAPEMPLHPALGK